MEHAFDHKPLLTCVVSLTPMTTSTTPPEVCGSAMEEYQSELNDWQEQTVRVLRFNCRHVHAIRKGRVRFTTATEGPVSP